MSRFELVLEERQHLEEEGRKLQTEASSLSAKIRVCVGSNLHGGCMDVYGCVWM
jgi:hypothetical protein